MTGAVTYLSEARHVLRGSGPGFDRMDAILWQLANDQRVPPDVYEQVCEAVFIALNAYAKALGS